MDDLYEVVKANTEDEFAEKLARLAMRPGDVTGLSVRVCEVAGPPQILNDLPGELFG